MTSLGDFSGGDVYSVALGASYDGGVIAGLGEKEKDIGGGYSNDYPEAFSYSGGSMQGLGLLDASSYYPSSRAYDVSDDGGVIVGDSANSAGTEAFRWTQSGGMVGLGDLAGGAHQSTALAVSPDGNVVVGHGRTATATSEAFRWTEASGMQALEFLDGANHSQAQDVSADGSLVVGDSFTPSGRRAFIWDETNGMQDLYDLLVALGAGDELTDWTLTYAMAISPDGMTVAGNGYNPAGGQEAWIATLEPGDASVPVPAAVWLLGSGLIGLAGLRRKVRR
jgi:probable HAF family extracellular repeat protein